MALRKPSDFFGKKEEENNFPVVETDDSLREELNKVEDLSEQISQLQQQLAQKVVKNDLTTLVISQITEMQENFEVLQSEFKQSNQKDIDKFQQKIYELTEIVDNLVGDEIPKYKKQITKNEIFIGQKFNDLKETVEENITDIREEVDTKLDNIADVVDSNIEYFNQKLQETSFQVKKTTETYGNLSKILENKISEENKRIGECYKEINDVKEDVVVNEQHLRDVDNYLKEHHKNLVDLKEEVFSEIKKLPVGNLQKNLEKLEKKIDQIKETYSKIEPEVLVREVIQEGLLNEPPETKNSDPLTPLNQNFVTLQQLQEHYRLFLNRIQQQISTIGGGGETKLKYLDDVVGIATATDAELATNYDGKFLRYNNTIKGFDFVAVGISTYSTSSGISSSVIGGISSVTQLQVTGISTFINGPVLIGSATSTGTPGQILQISGISSSVYIGGNLGIGTTNPTAALHVQGDIAGPVFESYELDDLTGALSAIQNDGRLDLINTLIPTFNYDRVVITNPFRLMITINGVPQSAFINNTDYVYQSNFLGSNNGFTIDTDNNIKFTESIPSGSDIVARVLPGSNTATKIKFYPFKPTDILLGY